MSFAQRLHRALVFVFLATAFAAPARAAVWMWDQNQNKIDDRIEAVQTQGVNAAHVGGLVTGRLRFAVFDQVSPVEFGVYIGYDHTPTDADAAALTALGLPVHRYRYIDYIRTRMSFAKIQQVAALAGVTRVESIPMMYATNDVATRTLRARDSGNQLFPSVWKNVGATGKGIVIAILDTGVNDEADPQSGYPGHESLRGKFVGGGEFFSGDPNLNTPIDGSTNPKHIADPEVTYHATHVAGTAMGTGGPEGIRNGAEPGFNAGMAPDARLVDCKVLSDAGVGFGASDALEWLIYHKNDSWGLTGADAIYRGVDVANMSLGGSDASDGTDADCAAVNAAFKAGIVVCVASGNDGFTHYMPSPAAADWALTVGAFTDDNSVNRLDDYVADYSNEGPRLDDGDGTHLDEMKPNVMGSGTGITSALGDPSTDGRHYHHINGTSMATPTIAGVAALVRSANPTLSAGQVRDILMDTADHRTDRGQQAPSKADSFHVDPNYHPSWGWGQVDAYAAVKEALNSASTQVVRVSVTPQRGPDGFQVSWVSQREVGLAGWELDRAPDQDGVPGTWTLIHQQQVASPSTEIHRAANRHSYGYTDTDPSLFAPNYYWYRVRWVDQIGGSHSEPPMRARIADSPVVARIKYSWTHNFSDGDLYVRVGTGTSTFTPIWFRQGLGAQSADSMQSTSGVTYNGTQHYFFHVDLTADDLVDGYLPPSAANPWFLSVKEGGYVNTKGFVNDFSMTVFGNSGSTTYTAPNPMTSTVEKQETIFWIPLDPATTTNHSPVLPQLGPYTIYEGLPFSFTVNATDPDQGQTLTYSATGLSSGMAFNPTSRQFSWTPSFGASGPWTIHMHVSDSGLVPTADDQDITINVRDRQPGDNLPPTLDALTDRQGQSGEAMQFRLTGRDPENGALTFGSTGLPSGATLNASNGLFDWTPQESDIGIHPVTFSVSDPHGASASESMYLVVSGPGDAPPPPGPCNLESMPQLAGVAEQGIDPISSSYSDQTFRLVEGTQQLVATLFWFGGPSRDLDFTLLDSDGNVVGGSASASNPEIIRTGALPPGLYTYRVISFTNPDTANYTIDTQICTTQPVGVDGPRPTLAFALASAAPNPFQTATALGFSLPQSGKVSLKIYDLSGRLVRTLQNGPLTAGRHVRVWDRRGDDGNRMRAGVYFARLESSGKALSNKLVMIE